MADLSLLRLLYEWRVCGGGVEPRLAANRTTAGLQLQGRVCVLCVTSCAFAASHIDRVPFYSIPIRQWSPGKAVAGVV